MKTTLCYTCQFGLCREWEFFDDEETRRRNKCLLGNDFLEVVTSCNRYKKVEGKVTYHDPEFAEYEKKHDGEA